MRLFFLLLFAGVLKVNAQPDSVYTSWVAAKAYPEKVYQLKLRLRTERKAKLDEVEIFPNLIDLDISWSDITLLPKFVYQSKKIKRLSMYHNHALGYSNYIDSIEFDRLAHLESLNIGDCGIKKLPEGLLRLTNLKELDIRENDMDNCPSFENLGKLEKLHIPWINIPKHFKGFKKLVNLKYLSAVNKDVLRYFPVLKNLEAYVNFSGDSQFKKGTRIKSLTLGNLHKVPASLQRIRGLESLTLRGEFKQLPKFILNKSRLHTLQIVSSELQQLPAVKHPPRKTLHKLVIIGGRMDRIPRAVRQYKELRYLKISKCYAIKKITSHLNNRFLRNIDLSSNSISSFDDKADLGPCDSLNISGNRFTELGDNFYGRWGTNFGQLRFLDVSNNDILFLGESIEKLKYLEILIADNNRMIVLPETFFKLQRLRYCELRNNLLRHIEPECGNLKNLKYLNLSHNRLRYMPNTVMEIKKLDKLDLRMNAFSMDYRLELINRWPGVLLD